MKHLGLFLVYNMQAASHQQFTGIYHAISAKVRPLGSSGPVISRQGSCGRREHLSSSKASFLPCQ